MKLQLWLALVILLVPVVMAEVECSKVFVAKFNYDNGFVTYKERVIKCGYSPDRRDQPKEGYSAQVMSTDNKVLHSFRFEIPLKMFFDVSDPLVKSISGGMMVLNKTDFALIFPYYDEARVIVVYNSRGYEVVRIPLVEEQFIEKRSVLWFLLLVVLLFAAAYMIYRHYRK